MRWSWRRYALGLAAVAVIAVGCKNRTDRPGDTLTCTPGESLRIGCTGAVGSVCGGNPVMDVCDGSVVPSECTDANATAMNDDTVGTCPEVDTVCPAIGRVTVSVHGAMGAAYSCYWDIQHQGGSSDAGSGGGG